MTRVSNSLKRERSPNQTEMNMQKYSKAACTGYGLDEGSHNLTPSQVRIKRFLQDSKKKQVLYAKNEGSFGRRVVDASDAELLVDLIMYSLYSKEQNFYAPDSRELLNGKTIAKKLISFSQLGNTPGEVHFDIIWVFYYDYDKNEMNATPVFKVFHESNKEVKAATFFDVELTKYCSWEKFLDSPLLFKYFVCAPREGYYLFHSENTLDLTYLSPKIVSKRSLPTVRYTPFYQVVSEWEDSGFQLIKCNFDKFLRFFSKILENVRTNMEEVNTWWLSMSKDLKSDYFQTVQKCIKVLCSSKVWDLLGGAIKILSLIYGSSQFRAIGNGFETAGSIFPRFLNACKTTTGVWGILLTFVPMITEIAIKIVKMIKEKTSENKSDGSGKENVVNEEVKPLLKMLLSSQN